MHLRTLARAFAARIQLFSLTQSLANEKKYICNLLLFLILMIPDSSEVCVCSLICYSVLCVRLILQFFLSCWGRELVALRLLDAL